jgi:hypothetical protein
MAKKINSIDNKANINSNDLDNIHRLNIKVNPENFYKYVIEIPILVNQVILNDDEDGGDGGEGG